MGSWGVEFLDWATLCIGPWAFNGPVAFVPNYFNVLGLAWPNYFGN